MKRVPHCKILIGLTAVLCVGAAMGSFVTVRVTQPENRPSKQRVAWSCKGIEVYTDRMNLTPEQVESLTPRFDETEARLAELRRKSRGEIYAVFHTLHEQVAAVLSPEQLELFEAFKAEKRHRSRKKSSNAEKEQSAEPN